MTGVGPDGTELLKWGYSRLHASVAGVEKPSDDELVSTTLRDMVDSYPALQGGLVDKFAAFMLRRLDAD